MADQKKLDFEISVSTRLPESDVELADGWAAEHFSDRSKILKAIVHTVLAKVREAGATKQSPADVLRRLHLEPA